MPERRRLARWALVLPGVLAAAIVVMNWVPGMGGKQGTGQPGSSFATVDGGAKAAYLVLQRLGHQVERRVEPLANLGRSRLAFLLAPQTRLDRIDSKELNAWLEEGGTLVYGLGLFEPSAELLRPALQLPPFAVVPFARSEVSLAKEWAKEWAPARTLVVHLGLALTNDDGADSDTEERDQLEVLARRGSTPAVLSIARGKGRIYLLDARAFSNGGLKEGDNALFLAALAERHAGGAPITFDEFAHGYGDVASVLGAIAWPLKLALGAAAAALLLYALAIGRRLGAVSADPAPPRRASIEQIEALAAFYADQHDRHTALLALAAGQPGGIAQAPLVPPPSDKALLEAAQKLRPNPKGTPWP
jgi:hypothetical protein